MELKDAGWHVELFERSRLLGGRATSFEVDGHVVDNGQHVYLACCTEFVRFVERVGMGNALHLQDRFEVVVYGKNGVRTGLRAADLPAPFHLLASFFGYKHLSVSGKMQIARALGALTIAPSSATPNISFAQWLEARGQSRETIRSFWEPFLVPALNAPLERMSAAEAAFVISTAFLKDRGAARFGYSKVPLANIMDAAASRLDKVHRSTAVFSMEADAHDIVLHASDDELRFDAAVLAVSPRALARLLDDDPAAFGVPALNVYEPFAIMDVHLWYDGAPLEFDFAAILDSPVQWVFQKAPGYLCCSISAADELVAKPTSEMVEYAWREAQAALPLSGARLERGAATRNPEGTYLAAPGAMRPGPRTALPNLAIAGAWTATGWPDTMESAVRSGLSAARSLLESNVRTQESIFA